MSMNAQIRIDDVQGVVVNIVINETRQGWKVEGFDRDFLDDTFAGAMTRVGHRIDELRLL